MEQNLFLLAKVVDFGYAVEFDYEHVESDFDFAGIDSGSVGFDFGSDYDGSDAGYVEFDFDWTASDFEYVVADWIVLNSEKIAFVEIDFAEIKNYFLALE